MSLLREVAESDLPIFFEHQRDPDAVRVAAVPARERDAFDAHWQRSLANESGTIRTVVDDGEVAGYVLAFDGDGRRLVGYWLGREFWGRGLATSALADFLELEAVRPLHATVEAGNLASIRVLEKCGFEIVRTTTVFDERLGAEIDEVLLELR
jgi:RimJ/RimL family protein N-acetyltransferase